jgi:uncharacterized protein YegJ (DUF2314 family)
VSRRLAVALIGATLAFASAASAQPVAPAELAAKEKAFDDAVAAARASLPLFWSRMAENAGGPDDYSLKVAYPSPQGGFEEIWLSDIKRQGSRIVGRVNANPQTLPMHSGEITPIPEASIIDWTFKEGRKRYGHFTTRVLAKDSPEQAAKIMATLSDNPLPADARVK